MNTRQENNQDNHQDNHHDGRHLRRSLDGRILGGVAAGLARYFAVDVTHVRIALVALTFLGGAGLPLYLAAWVLIPADGSGITIADEVLNHVASHLSPPAAGFPGRELAGK
ncbi:MAG TPA: PspC domain-containing protein [Streptosporangiaceae bacterium]|jgi:phage shock protein PspC (stress-responsive transcriptional regulator)|nr:PspC domain-containing protein [Streptosporangiaceae bacterium]